MALTAKGKPCFLPSRASVSGKAGLALRGALRAGTGDRLGTGDRAGTGERLGRPEAPRHAHGLGSSSNESIRLYLHPRDARLLVLKPMPLSGAERLNAVRSQLEASLLEDIDRLVIATQFESQRWIIALCQQHWLEALAQEAKSLGLRIEGIWPGQCLLKSSFSLDAEQSTKISESAHVDQPWPPAGVQSRFGAGAGPELGAQLRMEAPLNLLDAMLLRSDTGAWASLTPSSTGVGRSLALNIARARWAVAHAPEGAIQRPFSLAMLTLLLAGICLQVDSWMLQSRVEAVEADLARIFKETMPAQTVMVDPVVQLQRALDQRRQSPMSATATEAQADPLAGMLLMQRALSRAGGVSAAEAVEVIEWTGIATGTAQAGGAAGTVASGGLLSLRWKASAVDQQTLRPIVQDLASRGGWTVQWGAPQEGMMQWRSSFKPASSS